MYDVRTDPLNPYACTTESLTTPAGGITVLRMAGEVDMMSLPRMRAALDAGVDQPTEHVVADLSETVFCANRGLDLLVTTGHAIGIIVAAASRAAGEGVGFAVSGVPGWLESVWGTLFDEELPVRYASTADAVTAMQAR